MGLISDFFERAKLILRRRDLRQIFHRTNFLLLLFVLLLLDLVVKVGLHNLVHNLLALSDDLVTLLLL